MRRKGLELPIAAVVAVGIAVLVVAIVAMFFLSSGGGQISKADAERIFYSKCQSMCSPTDGLANRIAAAKLTATDPFIKACQAIGMDLGPANADPISLRCVEQCSGCDVSLTPDQVVKENRCSSSCIGQGQTCMANCLQS